MKYLLAVIFCLSSQSLAVENSWSEFWKTSEMREKVSSLETPDLSLFLNHHYRSPTHRLLFANPLGAFSYMQIQRNMLLEKSHDLPMLLIQSLGRNGFGVRRNLVSDPLKKYGTQVADPNSLTKAIEEIYRRNGQSWAVQNKTAFEKSVRKLPAPLKDWLAVFLWSSLDFDAGRSRSGLPKTAAEMTKWQKALLELAHHSEKVDVPIPSLFREISKKVDLQSLFIPHIDLSLVISQLQILLKDESVLSADFFVEATTPWGKLVLTSRDQNNNYTGPHALILDLKGRDTYQNVGGTALKTPVALIADVAGDDIYLAHADLKNESVFKLDKEKKRKWSPGVASGIFGASFLIDLSGNDTYRALTYGLSAAVFGSAILWDASGDDFYECYSFCQGASFFGVSLLIDQQGSDRYEALHMAQAFALTMGSSLLMDVGQGQDQYTARLEPLDFPSLVDPKINTSFAQGASLGFRGDFIDGHSWAGGVAVLLESEGGHNQFQAGFFAQGASYWTGVGLLIGGPGNDQYVSHKYSLGISTHYGVGLFYDVAGNDSYEVRQELGIGVGHDFALGAFFDANGSDTYTFANLAVGCGSANGSGFFWDRLGSDRYKTTQEDSLGCALDRVGQHSLRNRNFTVGFFLDSDGTNQVDHPHKNKTGKKRQATWISSPKVTPKFSQKFFYGRGVFNQSQEPDFPDGVSVTDSQAF